VPLVERVAARCALRSVEGMAAALNRALLPIARGLLQAARPPGS